MYALIKICEDDGMIPSPEVKTVLVEVESSSLTQLGQLKDKSCNNGKWVIRQIRLYHSKPTVESYSGEIMNLKGFYQHIGDVEI